MAITKGVSEKGNGFGAVVIEGDRKAQQYVNGLGFLCQKNVYLETYFIFL